MKYITLRFCTGNSISSALIRWRDWAEYSHVDIVLEDETLLGSLNYGLLKDPADGVAIRCECKDEKHKFFKVKVTDEQYDIVIAAAKSQIGKPYDYAGVYGFVFNRDWQEPGSWFCSELVMWCFLQADIKLLRTDSISRVSPAALLLSPLLLDM